MRPISRRSILGLLALSLLAVGACSKSGKESRLPGAVYGSQIPIYASADFEDYMGGNYYETIGGPVTYESLSWFFKVSDPMEKVVAFYATRLPTGSRLEDGNTEMEEAGEAEAEEESTGEGITNQPPSQDVRFKYVPAGAEEGEDITISIGPGKLQITEVVKPGKRKA